MNRLALFRVRTTPAFVIALWFLAAPIVRAAVPDHVDYSRDVLPILSEACYHCHGPDEAARKASLRLDTRDGAFRLKEGKSVIVPGKVSESELVSRIESNDPDEKMPPEDGVRKLTPDQIQTLRRWVEQGAGWGMHWAFVAPKRTPPPTPRDKTWAKNPIDAFILARLEKEHLIPAPEADRATLIRRITFDLTGLPPTPAEIDAFAKDLSPDAYETVVDRLLASTRYGERMATDWLDLARFADTHGYQFDRERPMWPYRDWVIRAFNEDLPFDQFGIQQLAGDLLPNATKSERLATAFNRLHMQNEEGGIVGEEFRVAYIVDRVDTMGTAFLGLTFECSRCHDHKYDPISQKDFYSLFSMFQNVDESGQISYHTGAMPVPTLLLSSDAQDAQLAQLDAQIAAKTRELKNRHTSLSIIKDEVATWLNGPATQRPARLAGATGEFHFGTAGPLVNAVDLKKAVVPYDNPAFRPQGGVRLTGDNGFGFTDVAQFTRVDPFSIFIRLQPGEIAPRQTVLHHSRAADDAAGRGYELLLESGHVAFGLHHFWPGNSLKVTTAAAIPLDKATDVLVTYDGSSRATGVHIFLDGRPAGLTVIRDSLTKDITYTGVEPQLVLGVRDRDIGFRNGTVFDLKTFDRALTLAEANFLEDTGPLANLWSGSTPADFSPADREAVIDYYFSAVDPVASALRGELHTLRQRQRDLIEPIPEAMVMQELPSPKPAFVLARGAYDAPGDTVTANTPHALPPMPADAPRNRLGLARWLFSPEQPLTARVTANRFWQQMFGRGIVETSDNFGTQGSQPTHPELLDYLATNFSDEMKWDTKRLLKLIAMSATYRQSSRPSEASLAIDPGNLLLSRAPARRLTAEMLRDQGLSLGGLLVETVGGPSVQPYVPEGLFDVAILKVGQGHGADLYRRSLYTFWKRTIPPPAMIAFDAADRSVCTARRQSTSTPLQALVLLNDPQSVESARFIAQRMFKEAGSDSASRLPWAFRLITGRAPLAVETRVLQQLFAEQRAIFANDPLAADKLLAVGETRADPAIDRSDLAAGTVFAMTLLNHDAAVMRR